MHPRPLLWPTRAPLISVALALLARPANAQTPPESASEDEAKAACLEAFAQGQRDRTVSHLLEAQKQLLACSQPACGVALMSQCAEMYSDIDRAIPSVVLSVHDEATGADLTAVEISINGEKFATSIDGRPIPLNPGEYDFTFKVPDHAPVNRHVVIGAGEKYRQVDVVFSPPRTARRRPAPAVAPRPRVVQHVVEPPRPVPLASWVLGGIGVAGLGAGAAFRWIGSNDFDSLEGKCGDTGCPDADVDAVEQKYLVSHIALGVGAAALVGAAVWYLLEKPSTETAVAIVPVPSSDGAMAAAMGTF